jgi:hypothetical protein
MQAQEQQTPEEQAMEGLELMQDWEIHGCDGDVDGADATSGAMFEIGFRKGHHAGMKRGLHKGKHHRHHKHAASSGFLPVALAAYQHRQKLKKIAASGNPRAANAAKVLDKAKGGDKKSQAKIKAINAKAKAGDPKAKDAMARLKAVDAMSKAGGGSGIMAKLSALHHDGIT